MNPTPPPEIRITLEPGPDGPVPTLHVSLDRLEALLHDESAKIAEADVPGLLANLCGAAAAGGAGDTAAAAVWRDEFAAWAYCGDCESAPCECVDGGPTYLIVTRPGDGRDVPFLTAAAAIAYARQVGARAWGLSDAALDGPGQYRVKVSYRDGDHERHLHGIWTGGHADAARAALDHLADARIDGWEAEVVARVPLSCPGCKGTDLAKFRYLEDIANFRELREVDEDGTLVIASRYEVADDGENPRLLCTDCAREFPIPPGLEHDFRDGHEDEIVSA